jgi:valacyclovir hydrolase
MPYFVWNHHRIFYRQRGSGTLLVLLPGNTSSSVNLQGELAYFSDRFNVVGLDFLGTGQSDRIEVWADEWWLQGAHQVHGLVQHLGYRGAVLVGTSGGAVVALLTAIHYPDIVQAVIADSFGTRFTQEMFQNKLIEDRNQNSPGQVVFWKAAHGPYWKRVIDADTAMIERFVGQGGDWFRGQLDQVQCPVLVTGSKGDHLVPEIARQAASVAEQIPNCRVYLQHEGIHPLIWSGPDIFRRVSDIFLTSISESSHV